MKREHHGYSVHGVSLTFDYSRGLCISRSDRKLPLTLSAHRNVSNRNTCTLIILRLTPHALFNTSSSKFWQIPWERTTVPLQLVSVKLFDRNNCKKNSYNRHNSPGLQC